MVKRLFIVPGWEGTPKSDWLPWLKSEMEKENIKTFIPEMPETNTPKIEAWVNHLSDCVDKSDKDTYFVGYSMGGQTVLRYLETLKAKEKVGGVLLVAGWINLKPAAFEIEADKIIAKPWLNIPIKWELVLSHTTNFTTIFSDNDPYVPLSDSLIFKENLGAKIVIEHNKGHINKESGIKRLASIKEELLLLLKK